jgi:hypothetical protein
MQRIGVHEYSMHCDCFELKVPLALAEKAQILSRYIPPYIARTPEEWCGHQQAPPVRPYREKKPAAVVSPKGILFGFNLFQLYQNIRYPFMIDLFRVAMGKALSPEIELNPPYSYLDTNYWVQTDGGKNKIVVSLVNFVRGRDPNRFQYARCTPRIDKVELSVNLKSTSIQVKRVQRISSDIANIGDKTPFTQVGNVVKITLEHVAVSEFLIIE